jgi:hypothetical protein
MPFRRPSFYFVYLLAILSSVLTMAQTRANPFTGLATSRRCRRTARPDSSRIRSATKPTGSPAARSSLNDRRRISGAASTPVFTNAVYKAGRFGSGTEL